jgi:PAS domain S-box-containing protein
MTTPMDALPDAVLCLDGERRITEANTAAAELTGFAVAELIGRPIEDALAPRGRDGKPLLDGGWHRSTALASVTRIPEQEIRIRDAKGGEVRANVTGRYQRDRAGGLTGAVLVVRGSARRAKLAATGIEVVSTVSHELRSPLTSVKGYTSLLLNRWDRLADDQKRMMLEQVHHDADRVTRLVTELLDISRLETGRLVLRRQMVDLREVTAAVIEKVGLEYADLDVAVSFADDFPNVYADPDKVEQVLTNLVENAAKYASPKGMVVAGEVASDGEDRAVVEVDVTDKGEGIPTHDIPRIFTKFFRRAETKPTGSGLGLWISRGLVEAHGGKLVAESQPGSGSTFRFTLPLTAFEDIHG